MDDVKGTSEKLLLFIQGNPGCHLRRIRTIMGVSMGTVQYQLDKLEKMGKVTSSRRGLYKYYFPAGLFKENEKEILKVTLYCGKCKEYYPIDDGIPNMLPPELRE